MGGRLGGRCGDRRGHWEQSRVADQCHQESPGTKNVVVCPRCQVDDNSWLCEFLLDNNMEPDQVLDQVCGSSSSSHKAKTLDRFCFGSLKVVVCTSVWAAGIDFPNVQLVVTFWSGKHQNLREDWQEGGRAGR